MASDKFFARFEGEGNPYPLGIFRIAFFVGVALHFFPALIHLDDAYRRGALRSDEWNHWLFLQFDDIGQGTLRALSIVTMLACVAGIIGLRTRVAAIVTGLGVFAFASFNGLPVQTLALVSTWAIFLLYGLCESSSGAVSVDAWATPDKKGASRLLSGLLLYQVLIAVFFAGIEKLLAGWPFVNEMGVVLSYPKGFLLRDWATRVGFLHHPIVSRAFTWFTIFVEVGTPPLLLWKKTRLPALIAYEAFFLGIVAMLEVPPLFYCMFAFGGLLALDDDDIRAIRARVRRAPTA
jgi:hypothetical protein